MSMMHQKTKQMFASIRFLMVAIVLFLGFANTASAQTEESNNRDFETWTGINLAIKLNEKFRLGIEEQLRLKNNSSETDQFFTQLNLRYAFLNKLTLGLGGRYGRDNDTNGKKQGYRTFFRYHLDLGYKQSLNRFSIKYRLRYQHKIRHGLQSSDKKIFHNTTRLKTSLSYNIRGWKFDPKISSEIFNGFITDEKNGFYKYRVSIGTDAKIGQKGRIDVFYRLEKPLRNFEVQTTKILGVNYSYSFD